MKFGKRFNYRRHEEEQSDQGMGWGYANKNVKEVSGGPKNWSIQHVDATTVI